MKSSILLKITLISFLILLSISSYSQEKTNTKKLDSKDGVEFLHYWKAGKCFNKKKPLQLNVTVTNTNSYFVKAQLQVNYYQSGILKEQSDTIILCLKPNQSKKGSKNKLNFSAGQFSNAEINDAAFTYEVYPIQIIKMRSCKENK